MTLAADTHVEITGTSSRLNAKIRNVVDQLNTVYDDLADLKEAMAQSAGGGTLAADWGFTGANGADNAAAVQALITSAVTDMTASGAIQQLLSRCA